MYLLTKNPVIARIKKNFIIYSNNLQTFQKTVCYTKNIRNAQRIKQLSFNPFLKILILKKNKPCAIWHRAFSALLPVRQSVLPDYLNSQIF